MIIGFTGKKGSGKDTAAHVLEQQGFVHLKMADGLKIMLGSLLSFQGASEELIDRMIEGDLKEEPSHYLAGRSPRHAMQTLGTEWGRNLMGQDIWTDAFSNAAASYNDVVCSDVRFPNEVERCDRVYRIDRGVSSGDAHISEQLIDTLPVSGVIVNDCASAAEFQDRIALLDHH